MCVCCAVWCGLWVLLQCCVVSFRGCFVSVCVDACSVSLRFVVAFSFVSFCCGVL